MISYFNFKNNHIILVTGGSGCVGSAIRKEIHCFNQENSNYIFLSSNDCDLRIKDDVMNLFDLIRPDYIIHLAAKVVGMYKNIKDRTTAFMDNIRINENILEASNRYNVEKGIFCLSVGIFSDDLDYPINESKIHSGQPNQNIEGYAYAKRMLYLQCNNYNIQYNRKYICIIPCNLYGAHDRFDLETAHLVPALIRKFVEGNKIIIPGTGNVLKQLLYSNDLARIIIHLLHNYNDTKPIICNSGSEISIKILAEKIAYLTNYNDTVFFDSTKPEGSLRRTTTNEYLMGLLPNDFKFTDLDQGLKETIDWYIKNLRV